MSESSHSASRTASKIAEKVVEILDVFDFSFFISGAMVSAALLVFFENEVEDQLVRHTGISIFGLVVGSYVLGLVCFAIGRPSRVRVQRWWAELRARKGDHGPWRRSSQNLLLYETLLAQGLILREGPAGEGPASFAALFGYRAPASPEQLSTADEEALSQLYTRMWVHVRSYDTMEESFSLLKRYWVLSASYDGMSVAVLAWLFPLLASTEGNAKSIVLAVIFIVLIVGALVACWHRAREYKRYQVVELVATVAHWMTTSGRSVLREIEQGPVAPDGEPA